MKFFTSDLHFGSNNTIKFDKRPFKDCEEFQDKVVASWNRDTKSDDTIYVIGDLIDCHSDSNDLCVQKLQVVKDVNAKLVLIIGNNEERLIKYFFDNNFEKFRQYCINCGFEDVKKHDIVDVCGVKYYLVHKPKHHNPDMLNLFGHSHKAMGLYKSFGFNIGCDLNNYELYSEQDIQLLLDKKLKFWDNDNNLKLV